MAQMFKEINENWRAWPRDNLARSVPQSTLTNMMGRIVHNLFNADKTRSYPMPNKSYLSSTHWNALVLATAAACGAANAQSTTQTPPPSATTNRNPSMSLPSTPQELWPRILQILKTNGGFTTHQEVEDTLGMKFTSVEKDDETRNPRLGAQYRYSMQEEVPGLELVRIGLFEDPKKSGLSVSWGPKIYERPNCLNLNDVVRDLEALGWAAADVRANKPGRSGWNFYLRSVMEESAKTGKPLRTYVDTSSVTLLMPNQFSQCVNGIATSIWHP